MAVDAGQAKATNLTVLSIVGTRPEAVKMAPVIKALAVQPGVRALVCATAQHLSLIHISEPTRPY